MKAQAISLAEDELVVTGVGAVSPVGFDLPVTHNSVRANICRFQKVPLPARGRQPLIGSPIVGVFNDRIREDRLWCLAHQAAVEALGSADGDAYQPLNRLRCGVFLTLAHESRPGYAFGKHQAGRAQVQRLLGLPENASCQIQMVAGHSSALEALQLSRAALADGSVQSCLIGGADSLLQIGVLRWLEDADRLKTETNSDGLIPGEAAAFLVVEQVGSARRRNARILAWIRGLGLATEGSTVHGSEPCRGLALTQSLREALAASGLSADQIDDVWCDLNGESYRAREWALASIRVGFADTVSVTHPADCVGDTGAVSGSLLLALAAWEVSRLEQQRNALLFATSEHGTRAAAVLCALEQPGDPPDSMHPTPAGRVCLDVLEEHLEEFQSLWSLRRTVLQSADYVVADLRKLDRRIEAHLQGLRLGGELAVGIARAALASDDPLDVFGAAFVLLRNGSEADQQVVANGVFQGPTGQAASLIEALCQAAPAELLRAWLAEALKSAEPWKYVVAAEVAAFRGITNPRAGLLYNLLTHESLDIRTRAWRAAGGAKLSFDRASFELGLADVDPLVRREAATCAIRTRQPWFLSWCRRQAGRREDAIRWLGILGGTEDSHVLLSHARQPDLAAGAILALGSLGSPGVMDDILGLMDVTDPQTAVAAGIAFRQITGRTFDSQVRVEIPPSGTHETDEFQAEFREESSLPDPVEARRHWGEVRRLFLGAARWRNGLDVSGPITDNVWARLDIQGRWEAGLRGNHFGWWQGSLEDFLVFPQR
jgi:3-oxoacyl-[acyl-carrier-protein] synthase-1